MIPEFLHGTPIVGILRGVDPDVAVQAAAAAARGGITALEITMNSAEPVAQIQAIREQVLGVTVGAGTVLSVEEARIALDAGATFIVAPNVDDEVIRYCVTHRIPVFPGAMTPTEVWEAHRAGATMVKLFPAASLGPEYIRALRGPFPQIDLLVTGGIDAGNIGAFIQAGARGAAAGGNLFPKAALLSGDFAAVQQEAASLVEAYSHAH
jgi:2-dehydro-3-deoxyphosphogluconate aldolase/(4S)-4-hydroxy-2-oxoglutarate aldolase